MPGTTGRPAEVLREGSGIKVDGTAGDGLTMSAYIKDAGNLAWQKTSRWLAPRLAARAKCNKNVVSLVSVGIEPRRVHLVIKTKSHFLGRARRRVPTGGMCRSSATLCCAQCPADRTPRYRNEPALHPCKGTARRSTQSQRLNHQARQD